ncbi:MAG: hypothetical protein L6V82_02285 [Clostridiales bacterium]|nr:MAG: hypothetical protein L6V82_02285 [Clostridiales bacterium]
MNKKIIAVIALVLVLTVGLVACNGKTYKASGVADGNKYASSPVENNGSFVVKQGGYVYFVNAYVGADAENKFGKQEKSCLYRAELDETATSSRAAKLHFAKKRIFDQHEIRHLRQGQLDLLCVPQHRQNQERRSQ